VIRPKQGAGCSDRFEGLDFGLGNLVLLAGSINTTLDATRFGGAFMDPKQMLQTQLRRGFLDRNVL
jgi:hypothetical protein